MTTPGLPFETRFWMKVDKTEGCWNWTASIMATGYGCIRRDDRTQTAHRVSYELANGPIPAGIQIDHICHNRACVNPDHLRPVTHKQNGENRSGPQCNTKSGVRGVFWDTTTNKWRAGLGHNGQAIRVGYYDTIAEADAAVTAKRLELFTHNDGDRKRS